MGAVGTGLGVGVGAGVGAGDGVGVGVGVGVDVVVGVLVVAVVDPDALVAVVAAAELVKFEAGPPPQPHSKKKNPVVQNANTLRKVMLPKVSPPERARVRAFATQHT